MYDCVICGSPAKSFSNFHIGSWRDEDRDWFRVCDSCTDEELDWMKEKGDMREYRITVFMKDKSKSPIGAIISQATISEDGTVRIAKWHSPKKLWKRERVHKFKRIKGWKNLWRELEPVLFPRFSKS